MKKRLFMIIAIMAIVAMAVVGLVACDGDNNNGDNNNGGGNSGGENNGGGNAEEKPITETLGLNINNLREALAKKSFTMNVTGDEVYTLEYEPTKSIETRDIDGVSKKSYIYKRENDFVSVDFDLTVDTFTANETLAKITMFIVPNAEDLFVIKDGKYSIKNDKYEDYYKKLRDEEELPNEEMWEVYTQVFTSMRIEFKADSISISYQIESELLPTNVSFEIKKIDNTSVIIPQEILDLPVPSNN